jgi:uncharacterized protein
MDLTVNPRTRVRRVPKRAVYDRATVESILDEGLVCHLAFTHLGQPFCIPTIHARHGDTVYLHGSSASRMMRTLAEGSPACLTVTHVDGIVLARSAFHHSLNYRSAMLLGTLRAVDQPDEKLAALEALTERLVPGRWADIRWPSSKEMKATSVLAMELDEASAKIRTGPPVDDEPDYAMTVWAGVLPLTVQPGEPVPDDRLAEGTEVPAHVTEWTPQRQPDEPASERAA